MDYVSPTTLTLINALRAADIVDFDTSGTGDYEVYQEQFDAIIGQQTVVIASKVHLNGREAMVVTVYHSGDQCHSLKVSAGNLDINETSLLDASEPFHVTPADFARIIGEAVARSVAEAI